MLRAAPAAVALTGALALLVAGLARAPAAGDSGAPDLPPDQRAYLVTCSTCHPAFDPRTHRKEEWRAIVGAMHLRANDREVRFDPVQLEAAIRWLETHGR
jgi:hypothetical protein